MDEGALIRALTESRSALIAESGSDTYEPTIPALMALLSKHPNLTGTKLTTNMVKKAMNTIKKRADALLREVVPPPAAAPARCATQRAIEANGGMPLMNPFDTAAVECKVHGSGISMAAVRHPAEFCIEAYDGTGARKQSGGDAFFVAIRGASRVRARITDKGDGSYKVEWKPPQSGQYQIAVSFFGLALPGSPFTLTATTPVPFAPHCVAKGAALYNAVARATQSFQVQFKDRLGNASAGEPGSPDGSGIYEFEEPDAKDDTIVKNRTIRVKVGSAPLVIRAEQSTESIQIGYVVPGQMVTVLKEVISQGKSANSRQQHAQQWTRRLANDKVRTSEKYKNIQSTHTVDLELSSDPSGIGFAFGGIHPGTLHAKGNLHETHSVSYSIGLVGEYLLHVRLRQQAAAVPGSPFQLVVMPGAAHALSTTLPKDKILGIVGKSEDTGCGVTIVTADVTGNACVKGGARVTGECSSSGVESSVEDRGDGSYRLIWHSQLSGTFSVAIKIDEVHVVGSPTQIKLISTHPELSRSEVSGEGLNLCVAGQPATFNIQFLDEFGNAANPKETFELGLALLKNGDKNKEAKMHEEFSMQVVDREKGLYLVEYTARQDGNFDLHVWAEDHSIAPPKNDPEFKYDRVMFPNSPFHCVVQAGAASPYKSFLDGWSKESRAVDKHGKAVQSDSNLIIAGDSVLVRPQICDELGNTATLPEGALDVTLVYPDGIEHHMNPNDQKLKMTTQTRGGITSYDIRHEATHAGEHQVHVRLHGQEIIGSPVSFLVHESVAEVKMCQLTPPPEPLLYSSNTYTTILKTFDRFGNPMSKGGLPVSTRLQLIKQGVHDLTTLMPNNNNVEVEDMGNGSYHINVTLLKIAATVKLVVNMDKNIPAAGGELQPVQLVFLPAEGEGGEGDAADSAATAPAPAPVDPKKQNVRLREAGNEVMQMMGVGDPGLKPKAAIAVAAEAFADAAKAKKKS